MALSRLTSLRRFLALGLAALILGCTAPERPPVHEARADGSYLLRATGEPGQAAETLSQGLLRDGARLSRDLGFERFAVMTHFLETTPTGEVAPTFRVQTPIVRSKRRNRRSSGSFAEIDLNRATVETVVMVIQPYDGTPPAGALATYQVTDVL